MGKKFKHLSFADRIKIEVLLKEGKSAKYIADYIGVHRSTIYREIKRGVFEALNSDLTNEIRYSPDIADKKYHYNLTAKGPELKIGKDLKYANFLESMILENDYSPEAVLGYIIDNNMQKDFTVSICKTTFYSYIEKGIFINLTNKNLPVLGKKKRNYKKVRKNQSKAAAGRSIEKRPEHINNRKEFGHWEMDTVIGKKSSKKSLLVLTERKTRDELIFLLNRHTAAEVVSKIDMLEEKLGEDFSEIFKSITVDNGTEFSYAEELEMSKIQEGNRTELYYCHPYTSCERGTNEVTNKMIRRKVPKGISFDDKTDEYIKEVQNWINSYPRALHKYQNAGEVFRKELGKIGLLKYAAIF